MSQSPITPVKPTEVGNARSAKVAVPSLEKIFSATRVKQASMHEPSPASTYGDTAVGDSVPATPLETQSQDTAAALINSLQRVQIDDAFESTAGSPLLPRAGKLRAQSERRADLADRTALSEILPSPSKSSIIESLHRHGSTNSSPNASRRKEILESPSWRRRHDFVRRSRDQSEDPFISGNSGNQGSSQIPTGIFRPRDDRLGLELNADTAQAILPPTACVFVANLSSTKSDEQLEYSVTSVFQTFGNVYVKIRRDSKGMPFAFCQYENVADAQRAITLGRGMPIDGRPCRTEVAKVNRSLYLSRVTGGHISETEARQVLQQYGAIEQVWYCSQTDKEMFRLPEGVWIMFAYFQDARDAQAGFRDDPSYRLEQPRMPDDLRSRLDARPFQSPRSPVQCSGSGRAFMSPQAAMRRAADSCSVFVGNLPPDVNEQILRDAFGARGNIHQIEIVRKPSLNANGYITFAFIEFFSQEDAVNAARGTYVLSGIRLRVERKETLEARRESSGGSPRSRVLLENEAMALMFQRGLQIGMANATVTSQASSLATPSYPPPFTYFPPMTAQPSYGPFGGPALGIENETPPTVPFQTPPYLPQAMGQYQYAQSMTPYPLHQLPTQLPTQQNYQWPQSGVSSNHDVGSNEQLGE